MFFLWYNSREAPNIYEYISRLTLKIHPGNNLFRAGNKLLVFLGFRYCFLGIFPACDLVVIYYFMGPRTIAHFGVC
jgi:hypothetical protein